MAKTKRPPKGMLYARYSAADIAALRSIQNASKNKDNPVGLTTGEQAVLAMIVKLSRKKGYSYATNAAMGKMLRRSRRSIEGTMRRLRQKGWVLQYQVGSKLNMAYRFVISKEEERQRLQSLHGAPGEGWSILVKSEEELPTNCGTDCIGSDKSEHNEKLLTSLPVEGEEKSISFLPGIPIWTAPSPTSPRKPYEVTPPHVMPSRCPRDSWLEVLDGTTEIAQFRRLYGKFNINSDGRFLRSLGRAIRRGRFAACPNMLKWLCTLYTIPVNYLNVAISASDLLLQMERRSIEFVGRVGAQEHAECIRMIEKLNPERSIEEALWDYSKEMEPNGFTIWGAGKNMVLHGGLACSAIRADTNPLYEGLYDHPEWQIFVYAAIHHENLLVNWRTDKVLRDRLFNSVLFNPAAEKILNNLFLEVDDYCGRPAAHMQRVRELLIKDLNAKRIKIFAQNKLGLHFTRERDAQHAA